MNARTFALLLVTWLAFGSVFVAVKIGVGLMPPLLLGAMRFLLGGAILYGIAIAMPHAQPDPIRRPQILTSVWIGCAMAFVNGMVKALREIARHRLVNIRLHFGDGLPLLQWLPQASLAGIDLLYPDPWPKRRHWKRRFVQTATVADIARVLQEGGEFRFATDIADYAAWTLVRLMRCADLDWTAERSADWLDPWPGFEGTRYEAKAKRQGRRPCYLVFRRKPIDPGDALGAVVPGPMPNLPEAEHALRGRK